MGYAAIAAAAVGLITSLISAGQEAEAQKLRKQILDQYGPEMLPHLERAEAVQMHGSALEQMPEDDSLRRQQLDVMSELENMYSSGGNTEADKASMELANDAVAGRAGADAAQAQHAMSQRGVQNSGLGYALNVQGQQNAANTMGTMARQNQVSARDRALRALESSADLAGNIRGDDFRHSETLGSAEDRIAMFNAAQQSDANAYNRGINQQEFDNEMLLNQARAGAANGVATGYERAGQAARETGAGLGNAALTYGMWGEERKKKP